MAKRILILGASGFLGSYLVERLTSCGHSVTGTYHGHPQPGLEHLDILNFEELCNTISRIRPELVVFLAGTKDVGRCEKEPGYAIDLNVLAARNYLASCGSVGVQPNTLYFSTDYVFDGVRGHYRNVDSVGAKTVYGVTNMLAERLFQAGELPTHILRVSAVMGRRGGFFRWLEENLQSDRQINLFDNTYFSPTSIGRLCRYVADVAKQNIREGVKIAHLSDGYRISRFQFGQLIAEKMGKPANLVLAQEAVFDVTGFQPDLSILPDGMTVFKKAELWNELEDIF
jgi:dTDP-4-dehydrorhamnose reductase